MKQFRNSLGIAFLPLTVNLYLRHLGIIKSDLKAHSQVRNSSDGEV